MNDVRNTIIFSARSKPSEIIWRERIKRHIDVSLWPVDNLKGLLMPLEGVLQRLFTEFWFDQLENFKKKQL